MKDENTSYSFSPHMSVADFDLKNVGFGDLQDLIKEQIMYIMKR